MSRSLDQRAFDLFDDLCDMPDSQRSAQLDARCSGDADLRALVEQMLAQDAAGDDNNSAADLEPGEGAHIIAAEIFAEQSPIPECIGHYRIIREIGRGGMGVVYEAEQDEPRRRVALKVMREGFASAEVRRRFRREAQLLGQLQHRGIAYVHEAGTATIGHSDWPYFAMEYIDGAPIDTYAKDHQLGVRERLALLARVADAVQHAHQKGILHRDLKMANVLVVDEQDSARGTASDSTIIDPIGQPKVLDFGVARLMADDPAATIDHTQPGQMLGTLAYMSPEQLTAYAKDVDTRTDVYSLGVMLYALLAGRLPHNLAGAGIGEATRLICDVDPPRLGTIDPRLRGDIETIVAKAIEREPERRYASAAEFAEDIHRFLRDEPIVARPATAMYQMRKFARRNTGLVAGFAATFVALIGGLVVMSVLLAEISQQRDAAEQATDRISDVARFQQDLLQKLSARSVGDGIERALISEYQRAIGNEPSDNDDSPPALGELQSMLDAINATNLGRAVLREQIAQSAAELIDGGFTDDPIVEAEIRIGLASVMAGLGDFNSAAQQCRIAAELRETAFGPTASDTLHARLKLADALIEVRRYDEAEPLLDDLFATCDEHLGRGDSLTIRTANRFGALLARTDRTDRAITMHEIALAGAREAGRQKYLCDSLNELGTIWLSRSNTERAIGYFDEYLERADDARIPPGDRINALNNLMAALFRDGRMKEAERYARQSVPLFADEYGDEHHRTIMARNNLARVLIDLDRAGDALPILNDQHALSERVLAPGHEVRQAVATNLIDALRQAGHPADAETAARDLLRLRRDQPGTSPGRLAQTLEQLGQCLLAQDRFMEAEPVFASCIALRESIDPNHWLTHRAHSYRGYALAHMQQFDEAERLLVNAARAIEQVQSTIAPNMREREVRAATDRIAALDQGRTRATESGR